MSAPLVCRVDRLPAAVDIVRSGRQRELEDDLSAAAGRYRVVAERLAVTTGIPDCCVGCAFSRPPRHPRLRPAQPRDRIRRLVCKSSLIAAGRRDRMTSRVKVQPACLLPLSRPALKLMKIRADATSSNKTINADRISTPQRFL